MMRRMLEPAHRQMLMTARIITMAFCMACVLYAVVAMFTLGQREPRAGSSGVLVPALLAVAGMGILAAQAVYPVMVSRGAAAGPSGWFVTMVIAQAVREGAAVIGLVLTVLTGQMAYVIGCGILAIGAMLAAFPRETHLEEHLKSTRT